MRNRFSIVALMIISALIAITLIYRNYSFSVVPKTNLENIADKIDFINVLEEISASLVLIIGSILILVIIAIIITFLFDRVHTTEVFPFDVNNSQNGTDLDGKAFSESLIAKLRWIHDVTEAKFVMSEAGGLPIPLQESSDILLSQQFENIDQKGNEVAQSMGDVGTVSISGLDLPIGPVMSAIYRMRRIGDRGCSIQGSLQKHGDTISAWTQIKYKDFEDISSYCEGSGSAPGLTNIVEDLSYGIAYKLYNREHEKTNYLKIPKEDIIIPTRKKVKVQINDLLKNELSSGLDSTEQRVLDGHFQNLNADFDKIQRNANKFISKFSIDKRICTERNNFYFSEENIRNPLNLLINLCNCCEESALSQYLSQKMVISTLYNDEIFRSNIIEMCKKRPCLADKQNFSENSFLENIINLRDYTSSRGLISNLSSNEESVIKQKIVGILNNLIEKGNLYHYLKGSTEVGNEAESLIKKCAAQDNGDFRLCPTPITNCPRPTNLFEIFNTKDIKEKSCIHLNRLLLEDLFQDYIKTPIQINSPASLKYFTEALANYKDYKRTMSGKYLDEAYKSCLDASKEEENKIFSGLFYNIGTAYFSMPKYKEAEEMFRKVVELNPSAASFSGWGFCCRYLLKFREAIDAAEKAICCDRQLASPWYLLGVIYLDLGCYASDLYNKSLVCFCNAICRERNYPYPWFYLGVVFYRKAALEKSIDKKTGKSPVESKWESYNSIALCCIEKAINCAKDYGYMKFYLVPLQKAACLMQRTQYGKLDEKNKDEYSRDEIEARKILLNPLEKDEYNRACAESLSGREDNALIYLDKALKKGTASKAMILYDPDFYDHIDSDKLERAVAKYAESREENEKIREVLMREDDDYIMASFEAVCGDLSRAMTFIKSASRRDTGKTCRENFKINLERIRRDPHFKTIPVINCLISSEKRNVGRGSQIKINIDTIIQSDVPLHNIMLSYRVPEGLYYKSCNQAVSYKGGEVLYKLNFIECLDGMPIISLQINVEIRKDAPDEIENIVKVSAMRDGNLHKDSDTWSLKVK